MILNGKFVEIIKNRILTILFVATEEEMISNEVWPRVEVVALDNQDLLDVLQSIDDDARYRSHLELDYLTVVGLDEVAKSLVRHIITSQNMKRAQNWPWFRSRWIW